MHFRPHCQLIINIGADCIQFLSLVVKILGLQKSSYGLNSSQRWFVYCLQGRGFKTDPVRKSSTKFPIWLSGRPVPCSLNHFRRYEINSCVTAAVIGRTEPSLKKAPFFLTHCLQLYAQGSRIHFPPLYFCTPEITSGCNAKTVLRASSNLSLPWRQEDPSAYLCDQVFTAK